MIIRKKCLISLDLDLVERLKKFKEKSKVVRISLRRFFKEYDREHNNNNQE